mgnify:CR=1 FL=1
MKRIVILCAAALLLIAAASGGWFFFGKTLRLSEIAGRQENPYAEIALRLFDFDTGLTRYDLYTLQKKIKPWQRRFAWINSLPNRAQQDQEMNRLLLEIAQDPVAGKFLNRLAPLGQEGAFNVFSAIK